MMVSERACTATEPVTMCKQRELALRDGEMQWDSGNRRWLYPVGLRWFPSHMRSQYYNWPFCPFCGGTLPKHSQREGRE